ncbi:MAG: hypothetical protein ACOY71_00240 [Gemmatimonadota bacterium]
MLCRFVRRHARVLSLSAGLLVLSPALGWGILVAPHAVFIDHRTRVAQVFLVNNGTVPEEVTIDLKFGYPDTDSAGTIFVRLFDSTTADQPSAAGWIKAYPRRVLVQPGERQVVRLLATPPADLPDGEYWTRLIATSRDGRPIGAAADTGAVGAGVSLQLRTIISVTYRKGQLTTGIVADEFTPTVEHDSLVSWTTLRREGTAAFLGTARISLTNDAGKVVRSWTTPVGIYYTLRRRMTFPLEGLAPGRYTAKLEVTTQRYDIDRRDVLPAKPVERSAEIVVR